MHRLGKKHASSCVCTLTRAVTWLRACSRAHALEGRILQQAHAYPHHAMHLLHSLGDPIPVVAVYHMNKGLAVLVVMPEWNRIEMQLTGGTLIAP